MRKFADEHLRRCESNWKPAGDRTVRIYLKARILPTFGTMPLDRIGTEDMAAWFDAASKDQPGAANRASKSCSMMFRAEDWGLRERGSTPVSASRRTRGTTSPNSSTPTSWPEAVAAIGLLALTGCRRSGALDLRWRNCGDDALKLDDRAAHGPAYRVRAGDY